MFDVSFKSVSDKFLEDLLHNVEIMCRRKALDLSQISIVMSKQTYEEYRKVYSTSTQIRDYMMYDHPILISNTMPFGKVKFVYALECLGGIIE